MNNKYHEDIIKNNGLEPLFDKLKPIICDTIWYLIKIYDNHFGHASKENYQRFIRTALKTILESYEDYQSFVTKDPGRSFGVILILIDKLYNFAKDYLIHRGLIYG